MFSPANSSSLKKSQVPALTWMEEISFFHPLSASLMKLPGFRPPPGPSASCFLIWPGPFLKTNYWIWFCGPEMGFPLFGTGLRFGVV
jgi:hypothetical protein